MWYFENQAVLMLRVKYTIPVRTVLALPTFKSRSFTTGCVLRKYDRKLSTDDNNESSHKQINTEADAGDVVMNSNHKTAELPILKGSPTIYNRISSASNYKGYLRARIPPGLYFNPAPSSSTGSIDAETMPLAFLPPDDPRRAYLKSIRQNGQETQQARYGPPVLQSKSASSGSKTYHLTPTQIEEIKSLRLQNPIQNSRKKLAKKYEVSPLFVSLVSDCPPDHRAKMDSRLDIITKRWSERKKQARQDRIKRKQLWYQA